MSLALVTGSAGFIGQRVANLLESEGHDVLRYDVADPPQALGDRVAKAEYIFHFAGVNRPVNTADFEAVNAKLTEVLCKLVAQAGTKAVIVLASSSQALLDNAYGKSKRRAEMAVEEFARNGGRAAIFRLTNVFGPGCRPNYNSVVATFAYNAAHGLPLEVNDPSTELTLVYVHDVARAMVDVVKVPPSLGVAKYLEVSSSTRTTLSALAETFNKFGSTRTNALIPPVSKDFERRLYATYLSYLRSEDFAYPLLKRSDDRGSLAEFLKSESAGQLFISRTRPGATRGNHFHHTKTEKFLVVAGDALIRFRRVDETGRILEYPVSGSDFRVVDIPPDYTHSIENVGSGELVVLFWASEIFDPESPDTFALKV